MLGAIYAALLYFRNKMSGFSTNFSLGLSLLRLLAVSLLAFFLLSPLILRLIRYVEEPLLIFVHDNSQSIIFGSDSVYHRDIFYSEMNDFLTRFDSKFDVRIYQFGESLRESEKPEFNDRYTDISEIFSGINGLYSNRNVGAVIVASDGIYNRGVNPVLLAPGLAYPVYTLAMGDTVPKRDLLVKRLNHNRITYLGNQFPLEVEVEARQLQGLTGRLLVRRTGEIIFEKILQFRTNHHFEIHLLELVADRPGMQRYSVELLPAGDEENTQNNSQEFIIEVIDSRQKVLLLANSPHPDIGAIKMALDQSDNYEVTFSLMAHFAGKVEGYNLVILHQLPSASFPMVDLLQQISRSQMPAVFIVGAQTYVSAFNQARTGLIISPRSAELVETQAVMNNAFALFSLGPQTIDLLKHLPPLHSPFAIYLAPVGAHILMYQKIGSVVTEYPLFMFLVAGAQRTAVIAGEGLWRWRLYDFARNNSHHAFDELIIKMIQFVSLKESMDRFRVKADPFVYETDNVVFEAELYNPAFELVNEPLVQLFISNEAGLRFNYEMSPVTNTYRLNAGSFSPGEYSWEASTVFGRELFRASGRFSVAPLNIESLNTTADHNLLHQLAELSGGKMFFIGQWEQLASAILDRDDMLPVIYSKSEYREFINIKAVFALLLLLLSVEWFLRKWKGSY